jgi:hypothetical protein
MSLEANAIFREEMERRTLRRVRRRPDDQACELCWSEPADHICATCGKYTCGTCTRLYREGTFCVKHLPDLEETMELKVGDVFVKDAGDGFKTYTFVMAVGDSGIPTGVSFIANPQGQMFSITVDPYITRGQVELPGTAKYGDPVPVETQAQETPEAA